MPWMDEAKDLLPKNDYLAANYEGGGVASQAMTIDSISW